MIIRQYRSTDYDSVINLYKQSDLYGGQFDLNRDARDKLQKRVEADPDAIFVAEDGGQILGTISLIEDGRVAWLFRFCVVEINKDETAKQLFNKAVQVLKDRGHSQVLVYAPVGNQEFKTRYEKLGFAKGNDFTCFRKNI